MRERNLKERVLKNSFWSLIYSFINRAGSLIFVIILANFLLPEGMGIYSIVLSVAMIFYTFADLGINQTLVRYLSLALSKEKGKVSAYYIYISKIKFLLTLLASIILFILAYPLAFYVFKNSSLFLPMLASSFYVFVLSFENFYTHIFYSIEKVKYLSLKEILKQGLRIVLPLLVFFLVAPLYQITGIFVSLTLCFLFLILVSLVYLKKLIPELFKKTKTKIDKKRVLRFMGFLSIASISSAFFSYVDSIMLGILLLPEYVGYYKAAFSIVSGVAGLLGFYFPVLLPVFTKLKHSKIENVFNEVSRYLAIITIPSIFGLWVLGRYILVIFGSAFITAYLPLSFLAPLVLFQVFIGLFLYLFSAKEQPQTFAKLIIVISLINIFLNLVLINLFLSISALWATAGAGLATSLSWLVYLLMAVYVSKKKFNIHPSFRVFVKPTIASLIMVGALFLLISTIEDFNLIWGIFAIFFGMLIYFISMILIGGLKRKDMDIIKLLIK